MNKRDEFMNKLEKLLEEYGNDFGVCIVIEHNDRSYDISGNLCEVCTKEILENHIEAENIQHNRNRIH